MKHCFKTYLKVGIVLFGIISVTMSCQKDDEEQILENSNEIQNILSTMLNYQDIPHYNDVSKSINRIKGNLNFSNNLQRTLNADSTILITDEVLYMTYDSTHTYTFKLFRTNPEYYVENIVLYYNSDADTYDEYLVQYDITPQEFIDISNGFSLNEDTSAQMIKLDNGTLNNLMRSDACTSSCQTIFVQCTAGGQHWPGENCQGDVNQQAYSYQECTITCPDGYSDESIDDGDSGGGGAERMLLQNLQPINPAPPLKAKQELYLLMVVVLK